MASGPAAADSTEDAAPLVRLVYSDGNNARTNTPLTADEGQLFGRLQSLSSLASVHREPPLRDLTAFRSRRYDCILTTPDDLASWDDGDTLLHSRPQMTLRYVYYQRADHPPPPSGQSAIPARVALGRALEPLFPSFPGLAPTEVILVNDVGQLAKLVESGRVDYAVSYAGNMNNTREMQEGTIIPAHGLPAPRTTSILAACHDTPQTRLFLDRLNRATPGPEQSPQSPPTH